ncbi:MAG: ribonuclease P protein component [Thermodesulfobacteriota bacterium]|nr:ribonuclease P protein component [Thermodesulfobacteriota bacterium]
MTQFGFRKAERLLKRREFLAVSKDARRRFETENFLILLRPNQLPQTRLGVTVTKKVGPAAVTRNRIKRQVREFFRLNKEALPPGQDVLVIAHRGATGLNHHLVQEELKVLVNRPLH